MQEALDAVRKFHLRMKAPVATQPTPLHGNGAAVSALAEQLESLARQTMANAAADDVLLRRAAMAMEELAEWLAANERADITAAADAWADRAYVLFGDAVAAGLPAAALFAEVHRSNMTKEPDPQRTGKAIKGPSYRPPDLRRILGEEQTAERGADPRAAKTP
jgi:predicted HAD superfamily Cof-like phosphohydrolase